MSAQAWADGKTTSTYPRGVVGRSCQSGRTKALMVVLHALGLSYECVSRVLGGLKVGVVKATVWNNVQEAAEAIVAQRGKEAKGRVRVIGADETVFKVAGEEITVGFVTNAETGEIIGIDILAGRRGEEFVRWLSRYVSQYGVEVLVSDDLDSYGVAAEEMGLKSVQASPAKRLARLLVGRAWTDAWSAHAWADEEVRPSLDLARDGEPVEPQKAEGYRGP